jgi:hypothetical protein
VANVTETCDPRNPVQLIAKVQLEPNVTDDPTLMEEALPALLERMPVRELYTDGGYNSEGTGTLARENDVTHIQTALRGHTAKGLSLQHFALEDSVSQEPARAQLETKDWSLPVSFRVALAYDAFATSANRLTVLGEFSQPNNSEPGFGFAGEYTLGLGSSGFSVVGRLGMTYAPDDNLDVPASGSATYAGFDTGLSGSQYRMSAGGGLRYAWQWMSMNMPATPSHG